MEHHGMRDVLIITDQIINRDKFLSGLKVRAIHSDVKKYDFHNFTLWI